MNWFNIMYLYFHRCANNHCLFQEFFVKFWGVVVHVDDGDKGFRQAVLPLWIFSLDVKVIFRPDLCVQAGPGLRGDEAWRWVDGKPTGSDRVWARLSILCIKHSVLANQAFLIMCPLSQLKWHLHHILWIFTWVTLICDYK